MSSIYFKPMDSYVLRTPLFSFNRLNDFYQLANGNDSGFSTYELQLIDEAIYLATPDLFEIWQKWRDGSLSNAAEIAKLKVSMLKYFKRMCTRCTPFGLFAGCTTGTIGDGAIELKAPNHYSRHTRLDMHFMCSLAQEWAKKEVVQKNILHYPNSSIYVLGDHVRYVKYGYKGKNRIHTISSVENNYFLDKVLKASAKGVYLEELITAITEEGEDADEAANFIEEMVESQLLVNELEPSVTGDEFIVQLKDVLSKAQAKTVIQAEIQELKQLQHQLEELTRLISSIDTSLANPVDLYSKLNTLVERTEVPFEKSKLVQTDLYTKAQSNQLNKSITEDVLKGITILNKLTARFDNPTLKRFRERYQERYGNAKMPLLQVLDVESGIGYIEGKDGDSSPVVDNIPFSVNAGEKKITWNNMQSFLLRKLRNAAKNDDFEVELTDADFKSGEPDWADLPDTISVMLRHLGKKDGQDVLFFGSAGGSSAANLLGRFAHGSTEINALIHEITNCEKQNRADAALAEIVHLPQSRVGNVLMRPVFREYEIPYLAKASVDQDHVISLADLSIHIDRNRVVLFSEKLQKEVRPHLSTAHNYRNNSLPIYHFLCDLQHQNQRNGLQFGWGALQNEFKFLPRVRYKNILFSLASWKLSKEDCSELFTASFEELEQAGRKLMEKFNLADKLVLADGDNELYVDLKNKHSLNVFRKTIKKRPSIKLVEFGYDMDTSLVKNQERQTFANQMVMVFEKCLPKQEVKTPIIPFQKHPNSVQRTFFIGDEWLYYKIYCGVKTADAVLSNSLAPMAEKLINEGLIDSWFFIRYSDPHKHIRIRFRIKDQQNMGLVIKELNECLAPWLYSKEVWNVTCDSYVRELERYGHSTMEASEKLFYHDSVAITNMLRAQPNERMRWLFALSLTDALLNDFGYDEDAKEALLDRMKQGFAREFGASKSTRKSLAKKYRTERLAIEQFIDTREPANQLQAYLNRLVEVKSTATQASIEWIKSQIDNEAVSMDSLMISYIHMLMNRTFRSKQRLHEMVLYDFLHVTYKSLNARRRKQKKQVQTA